MTLKTTILVLAGLVALGSKCEASGQPPRLPADAEICRFVADAQEKAWKLPRELLSSISMVESGRKLASGRSVAWPWTINVDGEAHYYETAQEAILAVKQFQVSGSRSIDVGCNQISLLHHPDAFASMQEAFDPSANASYAGRFLVQLYKELGSWREAAAAYHSRTPELGQDYSRRVMQVWPLAGVYGFSLLTAADNATGVLHNLRNYAPSFLADAGFVGAPPARRRAVLASPNPQLRLGKDQSWKTRLQHLAALGTTGG